MKKLHILCAVFAALSCPLFGQSFTPAAGYSAMKLFDGPLGSTISGLEFDAGGNAYYLAGNGTTLPTRLERRSPGDNYVLPAVLFDYGAPKFGSFVRLHSGKLYFGESTNGTIRVHDLGAGTTTTLATVAGNYELDFAGGVGWLSANPGFSGNKLFKLDLSSGETVQILASSDFSGPVAADSDGNLYYGATAFGAGGKIYRYSGLEANAGGLTLDAGHVWVANPGNAFFDLDAAVGLYQTDFATLNLYDLLTGGATAVGSSADSIGNLASATGVLAATVTDYGSFSTSADDRSAVFAVVPEPSAMVLLVGAAGLVLRRRRA